MYRTRLLTWYRDQVVCADRCVAKYVDATNKVGEIMQAAQMAQMGATPPQ